MSKTSKILIINDDEALREELIEQFALHDEFSVEGVTNAADGMRRAKFQHFDLVIIDVGLPDLDGCKACKLMRRTGFRAPIIMLSTLGSDSVIKLGLDAGATDYVLKPFSFGVLLARIRAHLRHREQKNGADFAIGRYLFRPSIKSLICEDRSRIKLTEKETSILRYLYRAEQYIVSRDVLLRDVWGYRLGVTTHTLETHIYRLRQKIEQDPSNPKLLVTEKGGYKLVL